MNARVNFSRRLVSWPRQIAAMYCEPIFVVAGDLVGVLRSMTKFLKSASPP